MLFSLHMMRCDAGQSDPRCLLGAEAPRTQGLIYMPREELLLWFSGSTLSEGLRDPGEILDILNTSEHYGGGGIQDLNTGVAVVFKT